MLTFVHGPCSCTRACVVFIPKAAKWAVASEVKLSSLQVLAVLAIVAVVAVVVVGVDEVPEEVGLSCRLRLLATIR